MAVKETHCLTKNVLEGRRTPSPAHGRQGGRRRWPGRCARGKRSASHPRDLPRGAGGSSGVDRGRRPRTCPTGLTSSTAHSVSSPSSTPCMVSTCTECPSTRRPSPPPGNEGQHRPLPRGPRPRREHAGREPREGPSLRDHAACGEACRASSNSPPATEGRTRRSWRGPRRRPGARSASSPACRARRRACPWWLR